MLAEYYKLTDIVHKYDDYFLRIKAWGVTASGAAAGYGATQVSGLTFLIAAALSVAFWITEARFKVLQLDHMLRIGELESSLNGKTATVTPRIYGALGDRKSQHRKQDKWKSVMMWPHVMFPHALFTAIGVIGGMVLLISEFSATK